MKDANYNQRRQNRIKRYLRIRLGISQMIYQPLFNILFLPIIMGTVFIWVKKDAVLCLFNVPQILFPIYKYSVLLLIILLPVIFILSMIETIGNVTARKDEANLQNAFNEQELRNGFPILMNKKHIKGSNVIMREFYSNIPMRTWLERQGDIADAMNVHFVEELCYGGKSNGKRIVMYTARGRKITQRGKLYDEEL